MKRAFEMKQKVFFLVWQELLLNIQTKFCSLHPKSCVIARKSGTHLVCVCAIYQNAVLLVDALDWDVTYTSGQ